MKAPSHIKPFLNFHQKYWESCSDDLNTIFNGTNKDLVLYVEIALRTIEAEMSGGRNTTTVALEELIHRLKND